MKQVNRALLTALFFVVTGSVSAATFETGFADRENAPQRNLLGRQLVFNQTVARHINRVVEIDLNRKGGVAVNSMYEAPMAITPIEIEIEKDL